MMNTAKAIVRAKDVFIIMMESATMHEADFEVYDVPECEGIDLVVRMGEISLTFHMTDKGADDLCRIIRNKLTARGLL